MRRLPAALRLLAPAAALALYAALFPWLYTRFNDATGIFMFVPIVVAAVCFGLRGSLVMGALTPLLQLLVYRHAGHPHDVLGNLVASAPQAAIGVLVGALVELPRKLRAKQGELTLALARERESREALAEAQRLSHTGSYEWYPVTGRSAWSTELCRLVESDPLAPPDPARYLARIHPDDRAGVVEARDQAMRAGGLYDHRYRLVRSDGSVRHVHARFHAEMDASGRPLRVLGTVQDVTERKRMEEQLAVAERLASVARTAARVAGELGQPLRQLWADVAALQEELTAASARLPAEARAEIASALGDALSGCSRIDRIVTDLEALVMGEAQRGPVPLGRVLDAAAEWVQPELAGRARLLKEYGNLPAVACDEGHLIRAFCNLLRNAAQSFDASGGEANEIRVSARPDGPGRVCVEVADTGSGIPLEVHGRIFDPFFTTRAVDIGTGLGLSVCRAIVKSVGGEITFESQPGRGSRFRVIVPVLQVEARSLA